MRKLLAAGAVAGLVLLGGGAMPATAAPPANQVCPGFDSGKIDVTGDVQEITLTAPEGQLITAVCLKGGSANQGLGIEIITFDPGQTEVTVSLTSGLDISHYSVQFDNVSYPS